MKVTVYIDDKIGSFNNVKDALVKAVRPHYMIFDSSGPDSVPYLIDEVVWVYTDEHGLIPCVIDKPHHLVCNSADGFTFERYFDIEDVNKIVFRTQTDFEKFYVGGN